VALRPRTNCELRDDSKAGPGSDVMVLADGEPLFSAGIIRRFALFSAAHDADTVATGVLPDFW